MNRKYCKMLGCNLDIGLSVVQERSGGEKAFNFLISPWKFKIRAVM